MDWSNLYPDADFEATGRQIDFLDIGCGFGGLLFALGPRFPDSITLGLEIRSSVAEYVREKAKALRVQSLSRQQQPQQQLSASSTIDPAVSALPLDSKYSFSNVSGMRANAMKHLPNFFHRASLSKLFFCFPDPHFKQRKHKARIVSSTLVAEYAYVLKPGGVVYTITDVQDLHTWMKGHFDSCALFERLEEDDLKEDECVHIMTTETEEGKKVARNSGIKWVACWRRKENPPWEDEDE
jgi:tRNA (guanine-N7-)-methyltransferase